MKVSGGVGGCGLFAVALFAVPGRSELGDRHGLVELGHGTQQPPDQCGGAGVVEERGQTVGRNQVDVAPFELRSIFGSG